MATNVSERQAREVVEAARESEWKLPSFGKELFLGDFRLDLIYPQPPARPGGGREGRAVPVARCASSSRPRSTRSRSSATPRSPTRGRWAQAARRARDEGARGVRRAGPVAGVLQPRARPVGGLACSLSRRCCSAHQSIGVAEPLRLFGTEEQKRKWLPLVAQGPDQRVPADRARRRLRPGAAVRDRDAGRRRLRRSSGQQAVGDERHDRGHRRRDGQGAEGRGSPRRDHRVRLPYDSTGVTVEHRNAFMGLRGIENSVTRLDERVRARGEPDRHARATA